MITKIKEKGQKATSRILFVGKLVDSVRGKEDLEKEITAFYNQYIEEYELSGLFLILG